MSIIPPSLSPGDLVGVAAPAGFLQDPKRYDTGCQIIKKMGFEIFEPEKKWPGYGYLADTDTARIKELHQLWAHPEVKAIVTLRGGYGSLRILQDLDLSLIARNPKLFIGFSDITVLHNHFYDKAGLICLHGPGLATLTMCDQPSLERLFHCLCGNWHRSLNENIEIVRDGQPATGPLLGGNLSSLVTMLGTPWFPDLSGSILLLEDINEPLYKIDRLLTQLWHSDSLCHVHGIILGQFCDDKVEPVDKLRTNEFVWQRIAELTQPIKIPIWGNFPVGHCRKNLTLPLGAHCTMDSKDGCLYFSND